MRCGKGHDHANLDEVKACYGLPADLQVRKENLVPEGPKPVDPVKAREIALKKAADALNLQKAKAGEKHGFTAHCPQCVAGNHKWQGYQDVFQTEGLSDTAIPLPPEPQRYNGFSNAPKPNRYGGTCFLCGQYVRAEAGLLGERVNGRFTVRHRPEECQAKVELKPVDPGFNHRAPLPDVPEGHYAIPSLTGNNDLDFFRVDRPTEGSYAGKTYIKRVIGGHPDKNIRFSMFRPVLEAILKFGVEESGLLYGQKIRACQHCNRHLTQFASRQLSCGPDCAAQHGKGELWQEIQSAWERDNPGRDTKDLGPDEGWLDQVSVKQRRREADAMAAAEDATWD